MLISQALAQETAAPATTAATGTAAIAPAAADPSPMAVFGQNMGLILLMFVLFYMLLIRPQQKRMKAQQAMLSSLKVGDKVVTGGGLLGTISRLNNDQEVEIDLGGGMKVTALRYTISTRVETDPLKKAA